MNTRSSKAPSSWDDPATAHAYELFDERHPRYREANHFLVQRAGLSPGLRVLDFAAGTGGTAEAALAMLGPADQVVCVEPSVAMRDLGRAKRGVGRMQWLHDLPAEPETFDRVLCGAAIWQCLPLDDMLERLTGHVAPGGALCFNVPSAYLGEPDAAGGGRDPYLLELLTLLQEPRATEPPAPAGLPGVGDIERHLERLGLRWERWTTRTRFTQAAYRDWLKIPVIGDGLFGDLDVAERDRRIDAAYTSVDPHSWRWEAWTGWTAWKTD